MLSSGVLAFLTHLHLSIAGFCPPRDKLGVIICYYVTDDVNILNGNQKMQVGSLKGTALRLCALSSVICFFPFFEKDNIELSNDIMISFRTGPPTENYCLHSQVNYLQLLKKSLVLLKIWLAARRLVSQYFFPTTN